MILTAAQKLAVLNDPQLTDAEKRAMEVLWGIGDDFYAYLFQCIKHADGGQKARLIPCFASEIAAHDAWITGNLRQRVLSIVKTCEEKKS